jgi:hypothetical protein
VEWNTERGTRKRAATKKLALYDVGVVGLGQCGKGGAAFWLLPITRGGAQRRDAATAVGEERLGRGECDEESGSPAVLGESDPLARLPAWPAGGGAVRSN